MKRFAAISFVANPLSTNCATWAEHFPAGLRYTRPNLRFAVVGAFYPGMPEVERQHYRELQSLAAEHDLLVTVEEGVLAGGFGSAVWETLNDGGSSLPRILRVGLPDRYVTHGKPALLREEVGLTAEAVADRVADAVLEPSLA